jgi:hypothetical protein
MSSPPSAELSAAPQEPKGECADEDEDAGNDADDGAGPGGEA